MHRGTQGVDVSIVMPFFNARRWIRRAVQSLRPTDGLQMELIAVDDASADGSADVAIGASTIPVRVIRNHVNVGTARSLNRAISEARGTFIARMDADDVSYPDRFARQIAYMRDSGCDLCGTWIREFGRGLPRRLRYPVGQDVVHAAIMFQTPMCHPTIVARREVFERFQYSESYRVAQDYELLSRISDEFRVDNLPAVLLDYRRHAGQTTLAKRARVAQMANQVREATLRRRGLCPTADEMRLHNLIRGPHPISAIDDLRGIEKWLVELCDQCTSSAVRRLIAQQWVFACVRAAGLGTQMWTAYMRSPLHCSAALGRSTDLNLMLLSKARIAYGSALFDAIARLRAGA